MPNEIIRVGVVGAGANTTSKHIPGLQGIDGVQVVSVCNRSRESSERVAAQFGIPQIHDNWLDLVNTQDIHAVVIGAWPYMHCRVTLAALAADKHVMCEARMAMNADEARRMRDAARAKPRLTAQIVPSPMTLRVDSTIKRLLAEGYLGQVLAIRVNAGGGFVDHDAPLHWRNDFDLSGFNIMSMGIWYEAVMRWVGDATRVLALGKTFVKSRMDGNGMRRSIRIPDHIGVLADMACGAQLHMQISSVTGLAGAPDVFIHGSEGTLRFSGNKLYGGRRGDAELSEIAIAPEEAGGWRVEEEFVSAIRGEEVITHTSFEDGAKYMEFTEAVSRSMAAAQAISLPL